MSNPGEDPLKRLSFESSSTVNLSSRGGFADDSFLEGSLAGIALEAQRHKSQYSISKVLAQPRSSSYIPQISLAGNPYLPRAVNTLGTTFTSSAMPKQSSESKNVAQRRSVAPAIQVSTLRKVEPSEVEPYVDEVAVEYERWRRETAAHEDRKRENTRESAPGFDPSRSFRTSTPVPGEPEGEEEEGSLPPLDAIPSVFFSRSFDLTQAGSFRDVAEVLASKGGGQPSRSNNGSSIDTPRLKDLAASSATQKHLSQHASTVERHLLREIEFRSDAFFSALSNLQTLRVQSDACAQQVDELRSALSAESGVGGLPHKGLALLRLQARRRMLQKVSEGVRFAEEVWAGLRGVGELVSSGEWIAALEVGEELEAMYQYHPDKANGRPPSPLDLSKVRAFDGLPRRLAAYRVQISRALEGELLSVLAYELNRVTQPPNRKPVADQDRPSDALTDSTLRANLVPRLRPIIQGLVKSGGMASAVSLWRAAVLKDIRVKVRASLPTGENAQEDEELEVSEKSATLAKNLRYMTHGVFVRMARETYDVLVASLEDVASESRIVADVLDDVMSEAAARTKRDATPGKIDGTATSGAYEGEEANRQSHSDDMSQSVKVELSGVVHTAAELANLRFSKVFAVRSEVHSHLSLEEFVELFETTWAFIVRCEQISQRMTVGLRSVLVNQAKAFLTHFHQRTISESAKTVENEHWVAVDVPEADQATVNDLVALAATNPPGLLIQGGSRGHHAVSQSIDQTTEFDSKTSRKHLHIDSHRFFVVSALLGCVRYLAEYTKVMVNCDVLAIDCVGKTVEFLKMFNSRTCQVVLGAGAMRSAGLKNITARHLALASQALSFVVEIIPYVREGFKRHLSGAQAVLLTEFDKLKRDYVEHQTEIHNKLVSIMDDRLAMLKGDIRGLNWDEPTTTETATEGKPHQYIELLVKDHLTLNKVLNRYLPAETVATITTQVYSSLHSGLSEVLSGIVLRTLRGKENMVRDVTYLRERLSELKGIPTDVRPGQELLKMVELKTVEAVVTSEKVQAEMDTEQTALTPSRVSSEKEAKRSMEERLSIENIRRSSSSADLGHGRRSVEIKTSENKLPLRKTMAERLAELTRGSKRPNSLPLLSETVSEATSVSGEGGESGPEVPPKGGKGEEEANGVDETVADKEPTENGERSEALPEKVTESQEEENQATGAIAAAAPEKATLEEGSDVAAVLEGPITEGANEETVEESSDKTAENEATGEPTEEHTKEQDETREVPTAEPFEEPLPLSEPRVSAESLHPSEIEAVPAESDFAALASEEPAVEETLSEVPEKPLPLLAVEPNSDASNTIEKAPEVMDEEKKEKDVDGEAEKGPEATDATDSQSGPLGARDDLDKELADLDVDTPLETQEKSGVDICDLDNLEKELSHGSL